MNDKEVMIFPYINIGRVIKMGDFEIHSYKNYSFDLELTVDEKKQLDIFVDSFRETFFKKWKSPKVANWIWVLKYKWTILRDNTNSDWIHDKIKILFFLMKLHISHDFFNPWMSYINVKSFDIFWYNIVNNLTNKFGNMWECDTLYSTIPENIAWLSNIKFYPINYSTNYVPTEFKLIWWWDEIFWINSEIDDFTELYKWIIKDEDFYNKILNIASIHYWLEQQNDLFFYYSIIPSIIEVLLQLNSNDIKKQKALDFWKKLDDLIIQDNEKIETLIYTKRNWDEVKEELWLIARTFVSIYDLRNELLHEWKKSFNKLKVQFKWYDLRIIDIFKLILKYTILADFIEKWVIENNIYNVEIDGVGSIFTWGEIKIKTTNNTKLSMEAELDNLIRKCESDRSIELNKK